MASNQKINLVTKVALAGNFTTLTPASLPAKANQMIGHIVAANVNAATTIAAKIQHSPDKVNWYDYLSFTNIVGAAGAQAISTTSFDVPAFQYVQAVVTLSGSTKLADVTIDLWHQLF